MDFADPQGGKGPSDRYSAVIKSHVRRYLNEKHDVTNAEQFVQACLSYGGIKNVNVAECLFKPVHQSARFQLNNVKQFRNFCFEKHGIRTFRAWDIGEGVLLPYHKLIIGRVTIGSLDLIQPSPTIIFGSSTNDSSPSTSDSDHNVQYNESVNDMTNLFECPEEACVSSFVRYGNLIRHLVIGNHHKIPEKVTLLDAAKKMFSSKLTNVSKRVICLSSDDIIFDSNNFNQLPELSIGWGLPIIRSPVRFTAKQKLFLDEKYNDGIVHGRFWKPETVAKEMQNAKSLKGAFVFDVNEWLTASQIRSYFSRIRSTGAKQINLESSTDITNRTISISGVQEQEDEDEDSNAEESFKDDVAIQEAIERITFLNEINRTADRASSVKRPLTLMLNESNVPKRSTTPKKLMKLKRKQPQLANCLVVYIQ